MRAAGVHLCFSKIMTNANFNSDPFGDRDSAVETFGDYYSRRAEQERQLADSAVDIDLRRIHLNRAASMERRAEAARFTDGT